MAVGGPYNIKYINVKIRAWRDFTGKINKMAPETPSFFAENAFLIQLYRLIRQNLYSSFSHFSDGQFCSLSLGPVIPLCMFVWGYSCLSEFHNLASSAIQRNTGFIS